MASHWSGQLRKALKFSKFSDCLRDNLIALIAAGKAFEPQKACFYGVLAIKCCPSVQIQTKNHTSSVKKVIVVDRLDDLIIMILPERVNGYQKLN